jgi:hypothetical protein
MENQEYTSLPLVINGSARNPTAFVYLMPGVARGGSCVQTRIFDGTGNSGRLDEVYIDGFPQTSICEQGDPRYVSNTISVEAVDQFQVDHQQSFGAVSRCGVGKLCNQVRHQHLARLRVRYLP